MPTAFLSSLPPLLSPAALRSLDKEAASFGIPELMLMENAASAALAVLMEQWGDPRGRRVWLFMGNGNNGGDAAALARILLDRGAEPLLFHLKDPGDYGGSPGHNLDLAARDGAALARIDPASPEGAIGQALENGPPDLIVDGLLGTGFSGRLKPGLETLIRLINRLAESSRARVLSLDIPSGLDAETGAPSPVAVRADLTVSFAYNKAGLCLSGARPWAGKVYRRGVGFPRAVAENASPSGLLLDGSALLEPFEARKNSYKNVYGALCLIGGQPGMGGAICLAALAALRAGAGLVFICAPTDTVRQARALLPEAMTLDLGPGWPGGITPDLSAVLDKSDAAVFGPGLGESPEARGLARDFLALEDRPPAVFDADALRILGSEPELLRRVGCDDILTPHPAEAAALLGAAPGEIQGDRLGALEKLTDKVAGSVVLKGADSLVGQAGRPFLLCPYDLPRLAIAGAGDVLAGCAGAFLASRERSSALASAGRAVVLHAMAALMLGRDFPERGLLSAEVAGALPRVQSWLRGLDKTELARGLAPWPRSD